MTHLVTIPLCERCKRRESNCGFFTDDKGRFSRRTYWASRRAG